MPNDGLSERDRDLIAELTKSFAVSTKLDAMTLGDAIAYAIREGNKDPVKEAQKERAKARGQREAIARQENYEARVKNCAHMYPFPYAGITRIAWAQCSNGIEYGFCPVCQGLIHPDHDDEVADEKGKLRKVKVPGHPDYERLRRLPRHPLEAQPVSVGQTY